MKNKQYKNELTYETIKNAVAGNVDAQDAICDHYEQYIIKLSKICTFILTFSINLKAIKIDSKKIIKSKNNFISNSLFR